MTTISDSADDDVIFMGTTWSSTSLASALVGDEKSNGKSAIISTKPRKKVVDIFLDSDSDAPDLQSSSIQKKHPVVYASRNTDSTYYTSTSQKKITSLLDSGSDSDELDLFINETVKYQGKIKDRLTIYCFDSYY